MSFEASMIGYVSLGTSLRVLDKLKSVAAQGDFNRYSERKEMYKALNFVEKTYEKDNWENLQKDRQFVDAFVKTKEYFSERIGQLDAPAQAAPKHEFSGLADRVKYACTKEFWASQWIAGLSAKTKIMGSLAVPLLMDVYYATSGASASQLGTELLETVPEAFSLYIGVSPIGRLADKGIDKIIHRYDNKLRRVEKKILLHADLKDALAQEISTDIPGLKKPEPKPQEEAKKKPDVKPPSHSDLLDRLKNL